MSTVKVNAITDASGGNTTTINSMTPTADSLQGFRNRIINGDMRIDQRNAGAAVTVTDAYTLDRWKFTEDTDGAASVQQVSDAPSGFNNSSKVTVTTADASIGAAQFVLFWQPIEGFNWSDLGYGAAGAKTSTLSFWVKSSLTGTFSGALESSDGGRSYIFSYTISAANTWEQKTVTIAGDTTGTWVGSTNGTGVKVFFTLTAGTNFQGTPGSWGTTRFGATGTTQLMSTLNATWQITGVQLEVGSVATPFERRPYGTELALCQRYFQRLKNTSGSSRYLGMVQAYATTATYGVLARFPTTFRTTPSVAVSSSFGGYYNAASSSASTNQPGSLSSDGQSVQTGDWIGASGLTAGQGLVSFWNDGSYIDGSAEL